MNYGTFSDEDLMDMYYADDAHAFEEIHRRYQAPFFRYALRRLTPRWTMEDAEDRVQETFLKIAGTKWKPGARFHRNSAKFSTWAYRCLVNDIWDFLRAARREPDHVSLDLDDEVQRAIVEAEIEKALSSRIAKARNLTISDLERRISKLPEPCRTILSGILSGIAQNRIAEAIGTSSVEITRNKGKCIQLLRQVLEDEGLL